MPTPNTIYFYNPKDFVGIETFYKDGDKFVSTMDKEIYPYLTYRNKEFSVVYFIKEDNKYADKFYTFYNGNNQPTLMGTDSSAYSVNFFIDGYSDETAQPNRCNMTTDENGSCLSLYDISSGQVANVSYPIPEGVYFRNRSPKSFSEMVENNSCGSYCGQFYIKLDHEKVFAKYELARFFVKAKVDGHVIQSCYEVTKISDEVKNKIIEKVKELNNLIKENNLALVLDRDYDEIRAYKKAENVYCGEFCYEDAVDIPLFLMEKVKLDFCSIYDDYCPYVAFKDLSDINNK